MTCLLPSGEGDHELIKVPHRRAYGVTKDRLEFVIVGAAIHVKRHGYVRPGEQRHGNRQFGLRDLDPR